MKDSHKKFGAVVGSLASVATLGAGLIVPSAAFAADAGTGTQSSATTTGAETTANITRNVVVGGINTAFSESSSAFTATASMTTEPPSTLSATRTVSNSDGTTSQSTYTLTKGTPNEETSAPALGQVKHAGTVSYAGTGNDDTKPSELVVNYTYTTGSPTTLEGGANSGAFTLNGDTWKATLDGVTLNSANDPSVSQAKLSDGETVSLTWGQVQAGTGNTVSRQGTGSGTNTLGQKFTVSATASRAAASTGTTYSYSTTVNGKTYEGLTPADALPEGVKPDDSITVKTTKTQTFESGDPVVSTSEKNIQAKLEDSTVTRPGNIEERVHNGTATYTGSVDGGATYTATFSYTYTQAVAYHLLINGKSVPFTKAANGSYTIADSDKPTLKLAAGTSNKLSGSISLISDDTETNVTPGNWGTLSYTGDGFTASNTFVISGSIDGADWSATLTATRPAEKTGQLTDNDRSVSVNGKDVALVKNAAGTWGVEEQHLSTDPAKVLTVTRVQHQLYENGKYKESEDKTSTYELNAGSRKDSASYPHFGITHHDGALTYEGSNEKDDQATTVPVSYAYDDGSEWTVSDGSGSQMLPVGEGSANADSQWTTVDGYSLNYDDLTTSNKLSDADTFTFTNGKDTKTIKVLDKTVSVSYEKTEVVDTTSGASVVRVTGTVAGSVDTGEGGKFNYLIPFTANRVYNDSVSALRVTETASDGTTYTYDQTLAAAKKAGNNSYSYTLNKLAYSHLSNSFAISGVDVGTDATVTTSAPQRNTDGSITFTVLIASPKYTNTYQVTIPFAEAPIVPDSSAAHLQGITVNGSPIKDVNGNTFNEDRYSYTVSASATEKVYILPQAGSGVFVSAGDVTQNASASTYRWVVTQSGKHASVYSVTVLRERDWKTADEAFSPKTAVKQDGTVIAGDNDTELQSHGYVDVNGRYVTVGADTYDIPNGGTFSYQPKTGQVVVVTVAKVKGMTYRYTVNVAAPNDLKHFVQHVFEVTYITPSTQIAALEGIKVNGKAVPGFTADKYQYTVAVARIDQWTIVPQFDEKSGMTVTTHKDGADATIETTSADGLVKQTYKVHVVAQQGGSGAGSTGVLAQTGSNVSYLLTGAVLALVAGAGAFIASKRKRTDSADK